MNAQVQIPEGFWENAQGAFVPEANVKEIDKLRDQTVRKIWQLAEALNKAMVEFKGIAFEDVASFVQISADQYGAKIGGNKGNVSLITYDGRYKIQRNIAERLVFDERLQAAKHLIDECLKEWTADGRDEIKAIIGNAQAYLAMQAGGEDFSEFIWNFVGGQPVINNPLGPEGVPATTAVSDAMSKALKKKGFKFTGSTICYAFMQAAGLVNDHQSYCFCHPANQPS